MPTPHDGSPVAILLEDRTIPAALTTRHSASSYGMPVLLVGEVAFGPGDRTPWGLAWDLDLRDLDEECPRGCRSPLDRWEGLCAQLRTMGPEAAS